MMKIIADTQLLGWESYFVRTHFLLHPLQLQPWSIICRILYFYLLGTVTYHTLCCWYSTWACETFGFRFGSFGSALRTLSRTFVVGSLDPREMRSVAWTSVSFSIPFTGTSDISNLFSDSFKFHAESAQFLYIQFFERFALSKTQRQMNWLRLKKSFAQIISSPLHTHMSRESI